MIALQTMDSSLSVNRTSPPTFEGTWHPGKLVLCANHLPLGMDFLQDGQSFHSHTSCMLWMDALSLQAPDVPKAGPKKIHDLGTQHGIRDH